MENNLEALSRTYDVIALAHSDVKPTMEWVKNNLKGTLKIEFRDRIETINENEMIIVPRGIEHKPIAEEEVSIMLFEPATTINTGALENERTRKKLEFL